MFERFIVQPATAKAKKTKAKCHEVQSEAFSYSLTLNINKQCADLHRQLCYNQSLKDVKHLFERMGPLIINCFFGIEYNQNSQIHYHCYFSKRININEETMIDHLKHYISESKTLWKSQGYGWRLKKIDDVTPELKNYIFKDVDRTLELSSYAMSPFVPNYYYRDFTTHNILIPFKFKKNNLVI